MFLFTGNGLFLVFNVIFALLECTRGNSDPNDIHPEDRHDVPGEPLTPSDFQNAEKIPSQAPEDSSSVDPIEKAGLFEGDIQMSSDDSYHYSNEKNAIADPVKKWSNGVVPYLISAQFGEHDRSVIARAILEFHRQTCITFKARSDENDYVMFTRGNGCSSSVGRTGGYQYVTLGEGCVYPGVVMHEMMHAIGFWHEQSRSDRDENVKIFFENIQSGMEDNFRKISRADAKNLSLPYDTSSVMHYGPYAFAKNRQYKTIVPKLVNDRMGQRVNFSDIDVLKINKLYGCHNRPGGSGTQPTSTSTTTSRPITTSTSMKPSTNSPSGGNNCTDNHKHCEKWAANGECKQNPEWMSVNCKKACNKCQAACSNTNKNCEAWASKGECSSNPEYMHSHCAKACKRC